MSGATQSTGRQGAPNAGNVRINFCVVVGNGVIVRDVAVVNSALDLIDA